MYDYGLAQPVCESEEICKLARSFCYVWLNCVNIAYMPYISHMGIEVYVCVCINIMLSLFDEAKIWTPLKFQA